MKIRNFFLLILSFVYCLSHAQSAINYENEKISKIISPPSPEAYKLGTFGEIPVGLVNGTPNITIPLTMIAMDEIEIPFVLNYSSSGVRVDDMEGYVGLSWQLVGAGVITRTVKDMPDEDGDYHFSDINISEGVSTNTIAAFAYLDHIQEPATDSEPDIYNFQFLGKSGKFIFDSDQNIVLLDKSDLKITRKSEVGIGYYFEIVDLGGTIFEFKEQETSLALKSDPGSLVTTKTSAWFLSKINNPKTQKEINLTYEPNEYTYTAYKSQSLKFDSNTNLIGFDFVQSQFQNYPPFLSPETNIRIHIKSRALKEITGENIGKITFNYLQDNNSSSKRLTNLVLEDTSGNIIDNLTFQYTHTVNSRVFLSQVSNIKKQIRHLFNYIDPDSFPPRLSYAQDYYGYFNGKLTNTTLIPNVYASMYSSYIGNHYNSLAERLPNIIFNKVALLNKITYPTGGYTLLNYDGVDEKMEYYNHMVFYPDTQSFNLGNLTYEKDDEGNVTTSGIPMSYQLTESKTIYFQGHSELSPKCSASSQPLDHLSGFLKIYKDGNSVASKKFIANTEVFSILLPAGNYTFSIENVFLPCSKIFVNVGDQPLIPAHYELQHVGNMVTTATGSRLKSLINYDSNDSSLGSTFYNYSGFQNFYPYDFKSFSATLYYVNQNPFVNTFMHINANDQKSFVSTAQDFLYDQVDVSYGGSNFEKGGETHFFDLIPEPPNKVINGFQNYDFKMYSYVSRDNAKESKVEYFDKNMNKLKTVEYFYGERSNNNKTYYGIMGYEIFARVAAADQGDPGYSNLDPIYALPASTLYSCAGPQSPLLACSTMPAGTQIGTLLPLYNVQISQYSIGSFNKFLRSQITTDYFNGNPMQKTTEYFYNNPSHFQITDQRITFPDTSKQETHYNYAAEIGNQYLVGKNMVGIPLETIVVKKKDSADVNGKIISQTKIEYPTSQTEANNKTSGLPLPFEVLSKDLQTNSLSKEIAYTKYDATNGNIQEYRIKDLTPVAIIWGYNKTQPIAKIEGATYLQVQSLITDIVNASNTDAAAAPNNDETLFLNLLDSFKKNPGLSGFKITTYTYDPLIGVRSITPPSGIREVYIYDSANRLKEIREQSQTGNILKEFKYNYKP